MKRALLSGSSVPSVAPSSSFRRRSSGLLLHVSSLPGPHGSGDLSESAFKFVDFLAAAGQSWWQMLPVGPPENPPGNSPYSSSSSLAGSPWLISLEKLRQDGFLTRKDIRPDQRFADRQVRFPIVNAFRARRLRQAWERFQYSRSSQQDEFAAFCVAQSTWLDDFALYSTLDHRFGSRPWPAWPQKYRKHDALALSEVRRHDFAEFNHHRWLQFQFHRQWEALRHYAHQRGIGLIGDMPICVSHRSADVWAHQELFKLDSRGLPEQVSGYPPDASCPRGQIWGHPQYHWLAHQRSGFRWWTARFEGAYRLFDAVRLDHFLGFTRLWSIPASARSARSGYWVKTPGRKLLSAARARIGDRLMIAEDLGLITAADIALRDELGIPTMRVLQWGLGRGNPQHRPHHFTGHTIAYTGTHDTNTVVGWFRGLKPRQQKEVLDYLGSNGGQIHLDVIRAALNSVANTVILPVQDLLGLDKRSRMNRPGTGTGNWHWRLRPGRLTAELAGDIRRMTEASDRFKEPDFVRTTAEHRC